VLEVETHLRVFFKPRYETEVSGNFHALSALASDIHHRVFIDKTLGGTQNRPKLCAEPKNLSVSEIGRRFLDSPAELLWGVNGPIIFSVFLTQRLIIK
jgi:hypothetical protein